MPFHEILNLWRALVGSLAIFLLICLMEDGLATNNDDLISLETIIPRCITTHEKKR